MRSYLCPFEGRREVAKAVEVRGLHIRLDPKVIQTLLRGVFNMTSTANIN
jgi:hypothetical protein